LEVIDMNRKRTQRLIWAAGGAVAVVLLVAGVALAVDTESAHAARHAVTGSISAPAESPAPVAQLAPATAQSRELLESFSDAFESAAAKVNPSVVPIFSEHRVQSVQWFGPGGQGDIPEPFRDLLPHFFGAPDQIPEHTMHSLGSGVIVSPDGYILTNNHVVQDADKLTVAIDKKRYDAEVVGTDPETDVAVIKIDAANLPAATLGTSAGLRVGQWVIAVGNPLEMLHSVTAGIISATGRSSVGLAGYEDFIQTDASINPGNSGGALADLDGRVIGINTAIVSPSGGNVGVGFAIPIDLASRVMDDLISNGHITRGYVGLMLQDLTADLAAGLGLPRAEGVLVADVVADGPGDHAGIERGDVIVAFEGEKIEDGRQLRNRVADAQPGTSARFTVLRNGKERDFTVVLGERPASGSESAAAPGSEESPHGKLGLSVTDLTPDLAERYGLKATQGVLITSVAAGSPAEEAGVRQGDVIERVGGTDLRSVADLRQALGKLSSGKTVALLLRRGENTFFAAVQLP